ncbi:hypothetical protein Bcav_2937 [Beutenbergia cavernae DSM 12333]|uniref:Uncharacterized protein n=1 Tax=Beutenbergia cavernae (strain ATCC BAA-8 / DSM 12333 / CCUG 43141 / JCM 11478 / NBRC 16432 / NCIMB 13614 / HKI 0122) TaxID=471853 RepID=C5BZ67_BEUC1|nr:hypothetical protein [Beutenbergia cavernae]ACQ81182.1 hypothetical protein Bcav_2937 [Beutenbergia cavernae DSM 12333]
MPEPLSLSRALGMLGWRVPAAKRGRPLPSRLRAPADVEPVELDPALSTRQRREIRAPLRGGRTGTIRLGGAVARQLSPVTCGASVLLMLAAAGDPDLAAWLVAGSRSGVRPPELSMLAPHELAEPSAERRLALAQRSVHERARRDAVAGLPWPRRFGTPPWGAAREARFRGVRYTDVVVDDTDVAATRAVLETVRAANDLGIGVPLYTGGDVASGWDTALPRHVVLAVPAPSAPAGQLRLYEPGRGAVVAIEAEELLGRRRPHAALGGWTHVAWAVLPVEAFGR